MTARLEGENTIIWPTWSIKQMGLRLHGLEEQHLNSSHSLGGSEG